MLNLLKSIVLMVALLWLFVWSIKGLLKNIHEFIESRKLMWKLMFDKNNQMVIKDSFIKTKKELKRIDEFRKVRKEQKEHRNMWNKALKERDKNKK